MEYFYKYLLNIIPIFSLEIISALLGLYYLKKKSTVNTHEKYFVYFLWFTVFVEIIASYSTIAYFSEYKYFSYVKDTDFELNSWLYNIYMIISFTFFNYFFASLIKVRSKKLILISLNVLYITSSVLNLIFSDVFFEGDSLFTIIMGVFILSITIVLYYFELLKTDIVLNLSKTLPIYISIGVLAFYLCITPIAIFSQYFNSSNEVFINIKATILPIANIIMYGLFIIGFLVCAKNKSLSLFSPATEK